MLDLVVPLRLGEERNWYYRRLTRLMRLVPRECPVIVVDDSPSASARTETQRLLARYPHARYIFNPATREQPFSIGKLRDRGAEEADGPLVLFHDLDFSAPPTFYRQLRGWSSRSGFIGDKNAFACIPVAFLTKRGNQLYQAAPRLLWRGFSRRLLPASNKLVHRVVHGSSAILAHQTRLLELGGHSDCFVGHGAEDFELLHRLSLGYPAGKPPPDYEVDYGSRQAHRGFRGYFARYAAPLLKQGLLLVHQWHPPRTADERYYAQREKNFRLLQEKLRRS